MSNDYQEIDLVIILNRRIFINKDLFEQYTKLSTDKLLEIVYVERTDYLPEAVEAAEAVLSQRGDIDDQKIDRERVKKIEKEVKENKLSRSPRSLLKIPIGLFFFFGGGFILALYQLIRGQKNQAKKYAHESFRMLCFTTAWLLGFAAIYFLGNWVIALVIKFFVKVFD